MINFTPKVDEGRQRRLCNVNKVSSQSTWRRTFHFILSQAKNSSVTQTRGMDRYFSTRLNLRWIGCLELAKNWTIFDRAKGNFFWMGNLLQLYDGLHLESQQTFKWPSHVLSFISLESDQMHSEVEMKLKANNSCIDIENWWLGLGLARKVQPTQGL